MKKSNAAYFPVFLFTVLFLTGCIDSSDKPIAPLGTASDGGKTELLTAASWKLSAFTVNPAVDVNNDGTPETNLYPIAAPDSCTKDDITIFKTDKTYTREEGATKCDSAALQIFEKGTWSFSSNNRQLILIKDSTSTKDAYEIVELSTTNLTISFKDTTNGVIYTFTQTLKH